MAIIEAISSNYADADTASFDFTSIPSTYEHLQMRGTLRYSGAINSTTPYFKINNTATGATGVEYTVQNIRGNGSSAYLSMSVAQDFCWWYSVPALQNSTSLYGEQAQHYGTWEMTVFDYANASKTALCMVRCGMNSVTASYNTAGWGCFMWESNNAVDQLTVYTPGSNWFRGSYMNLYGIKSA